MQAKLFELLEQKQFAEASKIIKENPSLINTKNKQGFSPLILAVQAGDYFGVMGFLGYGADPNEPDNTGIPPLFWTMIEASKLNPNNPLIHTYKEIANLLVSSGARTKVKDAAGHDLRYYLTPLGLEWYDIIYPEYTSIPWGVYYRNEDVVSNLLFPFHEQINDFETKNGFRKDWALSFIRALIELDINFEFLIAAGLAFERDLDQGIYFKNDSTGMFEHVSNYKETSEFEEFRKKLKHHYLSAEEVQGDLLRTPMRVAFHPHTSYPTDTVSNYARFGEKEQLRSKFFMAIVDAYEKAVAGGNEKVFTKVFIANIPEDGVGDPNTLVFEALTKASEKVSLVEAEEKQIWIVENGDTYQKQLKDSLLQLKELKDSLNELRHLQPYKPIAMCIDVLYTDLNKQIEKFFEKPSPKALKGLKKNCDQAFQSTLSEPGLNDHRGWGKVSIIFRAIMGILAAITIVSPAILEKTAYSGYIDTFFGNPDTKTFQEVSRIQKEQKQIQKQLENSLKLKKG